MVSSNIIGLGQLRNHTCGYFGRVAAGETLGIVRRGKLVAWIRPSALTDEHTALLPVQLNAFRTQAGRYFDRIVAGQPVEVVYQGRAVAHITAVG